MRHFRVYLTRQPGDPENTQTTLAEMTLTPRERSAIVRQYRSYLPSPQWLPQSPVFVWLSGENGKVLPKLGTMKQEYELDLLVPARQPQAMRGLLAKAAAAAALILPLTSQPSAAEPRAETSAPPSVRMQPSLNAVPGPPTSAMMSDARQHAHGLRPLLDGRGRPVELGAFHSNAVTHTNSITSHTNTPMNPHSNAWANHSNIPSFTVPHTNVVPGDFIF